jgi:predicted kinase
MAESGSPISGGIYSAEASSGTYSRLLGLAGVILRAGTPVIIDATFIRKHQRELFSRLAEELQVPLVILDFQLAEDGLRRRIEQRAQGPRAEASEATIDVLEGQMEDEEPLTVIEQHFAIRVAPDTSAETITVALRKRILSSRSVNREA